MLNIIGLLLIIVAAHLGIKDNYIPNQLLNFGFLVMFAYTLSLAAKIIRLPKIAGYILAGVIAGHHGLGILHEMFLSNMAMIDAVFIMLFISIAFRSMVKDAHMNISLKWFSLGLLTSMATLLLTIGFLAPLSIPLASKLILGLFAATFSPLMVYSTAEDTDSSPFIQIAFGGFVCAVVLWGISITFLGPENHDRLRVSLMPLVVGITSITTGFAWGYASEKLFAGTFSHIRNIYPLAILFIIYPICTVLGLDFMFIAVGVGIHNGLLSERDQCFLEKSDFTTLLIFSFFGIKLSLENAFLLGISSWKLVGLFTVCSVFSRIITLRLAMHVYSPVRSYTQNAKYFIAMGPMSLIILDRFLPGFQSSLPTSITVHTLYSVCTTSILISILIYTLLTPLFSYLNSKNQKSAAHNTIEAAS